MDNSRVLDLGNPVFVSKKDGKIGSIYFENGRICLIHPFGPNIYYQNKDKYMLKIRMSKDVYENNEVAVFLENAVYTTGQVTKDVITGELNNKGIPYSEIKSEDISNVDGNVIIELEFYKNGNYFCGYHVSRGGDFSLPSELIGCINQIYNFFSSEFKQDNLHYLENASQIIAEVVEEFKSNNHTYAYLHSKIEGKYSEVQNSIITKYQEICQELIEGLCRNLLLRKEIDFSKLNIAVDDCDIKLIEDAIEAFKSEQPKQ